MAVYARGKYAFGFCDRCGFRYDLSELKYQYINRVNSNLRVCPECLDIDHEQLRVGETYTLDPQVLRDPRPDLSQDESRSLWNWDPVGNDETYMTGKAGKVGITA